MVDEISISLIQNIIDAQRDMVIVFHDDEAVLMNKVFKNFVSVSSLEQYKTVFEKFTDHFVPHPSYFHAEKIESSQSWFDAVMKLDEINRVVSLLSSNYEPHAFSIDIDQDTQSYKIVTLVDITQKLIKRIMIENKTNIDSSSGAYSKTYFLQIAQSYEDAAVFNEKIILIILVKVDGSDFVNNKEMLKKFVDCFKNTIRQDDMLVRWSDNAFLLNFFVEKADDSKFMLAKLNNVAMDFSEEIKCTFTIGSKKEEESVTSLIKRLTNPSNE